ncbi:hypothetical protein [Limnohabitans sp. Jir72]|uniref:hypothetical protein n=1 Tax=Limnohabitans sp. Jir72 TaxID=1977909 RepID=UPI000D38DD17|nr:hypothetical protein [Limnohabitans sp. Jir72]PUE31752.1 hypothetical protein B9Z52_09710 [Limnohabitans sp. Jir72]
MKTKISLIALAVLSVGAQAADWSDTSVGYRYASQQSEPGVSDSVSKNILSVTHVSGDKLGTNFFTIDLLKSGSNDPAASNAPSGAQEWYGFYKRSFSLTALSGQPVTLGFAKDVSLTARVDAGAKNTAFAPAPFKVRLGASAAMPVSAGFWDVGVELYKEKNHNGFVGTGKDVNFDNAVALTSAWAIPAGPGTFGGFIDIVGPKGNDGFGNKTKTETLARATYLLDIGGPKSGLKAGVGLEYWNNKFGCDNGNPLSTNGKANSCKATTPLLLVEYHL